MPALRILAATVGAVAGLTAVVWVSGGTELAECRAERDAAERQRDLAGLERMQARERAELAVGALEVCNNSDGGRR